MRHIPRQHRYAQWDGSQQLPLDADAIMSELTEDLIEHGDLRWAMRNLLSRGMEIPQGGYLQGMRDMLKQLRDRKREQLERFDLSSIFDGFREKLDEILGISSEPRHEVLPVSLAIRESSAPPRR